MRFLALGVCLSLLFGSGRADAATLMVNAGGDLQAAINAAQPGDTILVQAGAVFTGPYTLPVKSGIGYITIRSGAPDGVLPAAGVRIDPADAAQLPKIRSTQNGPAFKTSGAAAYWRLQFLEILPGAAVSSANLVEFGSAGASQTTLAVVPHHLVIDRCYIHGNPATEQVRGIALNSGDTQILNSYVSDIKATFFDAQAIAGWNGPGPYLIENNYLEATAENILFGGSDPFIHDLVPSNITIRRNLIRKPLAWMSQSWTMKNLIQLKNADTVVIEGNTIENNWAANQQGYAIVMSPRNQGGTAPWSVVQNITVRNNVIRHVAAVFSISGYDDLATSRQTNNIQIINNLVYNVTGAYAKPGQSGNGWFAIIGNGPRDITFDHNTIDYEGYDGILLYEAPNPAATAIYGFVFTNNLMRDNAYAIFGSNSQPGTVSLNAYTPGWVVLRNAIGGADPRRYPPNNDSHRAPCRTSIPVTFAGGPEMVSSESYNCPAERTLMDMRPKSAACLSRRFTGLAGPLVGAAQHDGAGQELQIETRLGELSRQQVQQLRMARCVGLVHVIHRLDDAPPKQPPPRPVHHRAGEVWILRRRHPLSQSGAVRGRLRCP